MLRYFRINDPYRLLGLLAILVLIYLPLFIDAPPITYPELKSMVVGYKINNGSALYTELIDSTAPLAGWFHALFDMVFGNSLLARRILAVFIIFSQAVFLGLVFSDKKAFSENTFIPSLIFVILFFFSFDTYALSGELLGSGFLLLALSNIFKEMEFREQRNEPVFNVGLFIGLASLFSFSNIVYLFAAFIILGIYTRSSARKFLLLLFGVLFPHFFIFSIYFLKGGVADLWQYYYLPNLAFQMNRYISSGSLWFLGIVPLAYLIVSLFTLNREARFTKYQSQLVQVMFFWMIFSFLKIFYSKDLRPQSFITLIPSIGFFITHFLLMIRRRKIAEISLWVLLISIVTISYLARYGKLQPVRYNSLIVRASTLNKHTNRKVLVLADDLASYRNNRLGASFLNWKLSKEIFEQPEYYENVLRVYKAFKADAPDIIIDPERHMKRFFEQIPELRKQYSATEEGYQKISN